MLFLLNFLMISPYILGWKSILCNILAILTSIKYVKRVCVRIIKIKWFEHKGNVW